MITKAKLAIAGRAFPLGFQDKILSETTFSHLCRSNNAGRNGEGTSEQLQRWYTEDTLAQLRYLWMLVERQKCGAREILTALFSDVLFDCASTKQAPTRTKRIRRHHWGWVADNVIPHDPQEHDAIRMFRERLAAVPLDPGFEYKNDALVLQQDARHLALHSDTVDLIVTSPPYIGMIDYTTANRLFFAWMNQAMEKERKNEIGARYRRGRKKLVDEYLADMIAVRGEMFRVLKRNSYCAIIIGESQKFPNTVTRLIELFSDRFTVAWGPIERSPSRRRVSDRTAHATVEYIWVLQKV